MKPSLLKLAALASALAVAAGAFMARADDPTADHTPQPTLKAGDPAPKLQAGKWVQGDPVTSLNKGTAYLVEFWATWCGPCRQAIPHLNEKYLKYKDKGLVVIGQDVMEDDDSLVAPFVKKMGDKMSYRVALDDKSAGPPGKMIQIWAAPTGIEGIPLAILVDTKGIITWIGRPMDLKEETIEDALAGKFDAQKAATEADEARKKEAQIDRLDEAMRLAVQARDWDTASAKLDEISKLMPADEQGLLDQARFQISLGKKDYPTAYKLARKMSDANKEDAQIQNGLAWVIAADPTIEQRDLDLAHTFATRADAAADGKEPAFLDTLARIQFMQGKHDEAVATETKALGLVQDNNQKAMFQNVLDSYKKGELPKVGEAPNQ